jgi:hypothetical protein
LRSDYLACLAWREKGALILAIGGYLAYSLAPKLHLGTPLSGQLDCPQKRPCPAPKVWDYPTVTVIADNKKRVTLPTKPGERFDVRVMGDGQFVLTRLEPSRPRPAKVTMRKIGRYSVGRLDRPISETALREALATS